MTGYSRNYYEGTSVLRLDIIFDKLLQKSVQDFEHLVLFHGQEIPNWSSSLWVWSRSSLHTFMKPVSFNYADMISHYEWKKSGRCCKYKRQLLALDISIQWARMYNLLLKWNPGFSKTCQILKCRRTLQLVVLKRLIEIQLGNAIVLLYAILVVLKLGYWIIA